MLELFREPVYPKKTNNTDRFSDVCRQNRIVGGEIARGRKRVSGWMYHEVKIYLPQ